MPFAVRQWPAFPDPRSPAFAIDGWNFGQVPPFSWTVATTGATGIYSFLNAGLLMRNSFASPSFSDYDSLIPPPFHVTLVFTILGFQAIQPLPVPHTIRFRVQVFRETSLNFQGDIHSVFPTAIQVHGPMPMVEIVPSEGTIPNPLTFRPEIWSAE